MCVAWKEEKRKIVFLIKMHSMCLRLGLHKWQDMSMCAGLAVLVPQALAYCYDYDFLIQLLFKSYKVISSLQNAAWEKENNNKEKNKMQKKYMSTLAGAACVYTRTHAYANNHITHTRPPWCWWVQNNKERKRVREGEEREATKPDKSNLKRQLSPADKMLPCHALFHNAKFIYFAAATVSRTIRLLSCCALPAAWTATATAALAYPSFVTVAFTTVAFILLLCILILLKARAVASLQN